MAAKLLRAKQLVRTMRVRLALEHGYSKVNRVGLGGVTSITLSPDGTKVEIVHRRGIDTYMAVSIVEMFIEVVPVSTAPLTR